MVSGLVISFWTEYDTQLNDTASELEQKLKTCLTEYVYYDEVAVLFTRLLQESRDFIATLKQHKIQFAQLENSKILNLDQILLLCTTLTENLKTKYPLRNKVADMLEERRRSLRNSHQVTSMEHNLLTIATQSILAGALTNLHGLPNEKFAPFVKPLMESIKREENEILQKHAAQNLAKLIDQVIDKSMSPNNKIITNLCTMLRCDPNYTPKVPPLSSKPTDTQEIDNPYYGIIALPSTPSISRSGNCVRGRPSVSTTIELPPLEDILNNTDDTVKKQNLIQRKGAAYALGQIFSYFKGDLPKKLPIMWELLFSFIDTKVTADYIDSLYNGICTEEATNCLVNSLQLLESVAPNIHGSLHDKLFSVTNKLALLVRHPLKAVRIFNYKTKFLE